MSAWQFQRLLLSPASSAHYHTAVPQDVVRQTDIHELQREAGPSVFSPKFISLAAAAADGLWRLNRQAHGGYCGLPLLNLKVVYRVKAELVWCAPPPIHELSWFC